MKLAKVLLSAALLLMALVVPSGVTAWSNGGYSDNPSRPDYGTHDWIAQHALEWLPEKEKVYIEENIQAYLYGTELPDNGQASDGIGDTFLQHIYYFANESLQDDASAIRASEVYVETLQFLAEGNLAFAAKYAGILTHYVSDVAVFGHVMGAGTDWGTEEHHSDYESYVNTRTNSYEDDFNVYLSFDGSLENLSAYDAALDVAYDTTFDVGGNLTAIWMDQNYDWSDPVFKDRAGESLNLAVNRVADVLHTLYLEFSAEIGDLDSLVDYLEGRFNSTVSLMEASPVAEQGIYYLVSDNLWASHVIREFNVSLADSIEDTLRTLATDHGIPQDETGLPVSLLHEAVIPNHTIPYPIHNISQLVIHENDYTIKTVVYNSTPVFTDYLDYGDLPLYLALSEFYSGNVTGARSLVAHLAEMWDGTGLNDTVHRNDTHGHYETYKLALLVYTADTVGVELESRLEMETRIWEQQNPKTGGIHTHFSSTEARLNDTNIETSSIVLMAFAGQSQAGIDVVVNEVELDPPGNDSYLYVEEWVELYNPTGDTVDLGGWTLQTLQGENVAITIEAGTLLDPGGHLRVGRGSQWLDNTDETILLNNSQSDLVDQTPMLSDNDNNNMTWQRYPDGHDTNSSEDWVFEQSTENFENIPDFGSVPIFVAMAAFCYLLSLLLREQERYAST